MTAAITQIHRHPLKGLNAEPLARATLTPGEGLPHDRRFALAHGSTAFDTQAPEWRPKTNFLMLMRDEKLAQLRIAFDEETGELAIHRAGKQVVRAKATEPLGRTLIEQFFAGFLGAAARGTPKLLEAPGHMFTDTPEKCLSLINLASVTDLERVMRTDIDPLRFRANIYFEGAPAWAEFDWIGKEIEIGPARLRITARIGRCAATSVNPVTAARDMNVVKALQRGFGHIDMGVYAKVIGGGEIATGDRITLA
ncbi:MAG: MOSC domain-containing protein [Alphaproteobacteria bacterium]